MAFDYVMWNGKLWECHELTRTYSMYYLDPAGKLWFIDCTDCHDYEIIQEGDPGYDAQQTWKNYKIIASGKNGKVSPTNFTGQLNLLPKLVQHRPNTQELRFKDGVRLPGN